MKTKHLILILISALILTIASSALAERGRGMRQHENIALNPLSQIELSKEQIEKIRNLRLAYEESITPLKVQQYQLKAELYILWLQMPPDTERIKSEQKKIHDIKFKILEENTDFKIDVINVLTKDQLTRFLALGGNRFQDPGESNHRQPRSR